eukprot:scaffold133365_cov65-Phaeocystis_antarctica.AAC.1
MHENVIKSEAAMRTFWDYLMQRPVKEKMTKADLPVTTYQQELQRLNEPPVIQWLQHLATESRAKHVTMNSEQMWHNYRNFCEDTNIKQESVNKRRFETILGMKLRSMEGACAKRRGNERTRKFDLEWLRGHYNIELSDEPEMLEDPE